VRRVALLVLVALVAGVASSGAEVPSTACPPPAASPPPGAVPTTPVAAAEPTPEQVLVCVGAEAITGATYSHWLTVAKAEAGPSVKRHHTASAKALQSEVLGFLISSEWVIGEAKDRGVSVSAAKIKGEFDHIRHAQFPKRREFQAFLRGSGETVADLLFRVELNLLSAGIQKQVEAGHHGAASKRRALSRFVNGFKVKWQAQTYCAAQYAVADCGHVQSSV
jgi:hypothetical protein